MEAKQLQKMNREHDHHQKTPQKKEKEIEESSDRDTDGEEKKVDVSFFTRLIFPENFKVQANRINNF